MFSRSSIHLENITQAEEGSLHSDRLLKLEKEMDEQQNSSEKEKNIVSAKNNSNDTENSLDANDEPPPDFLDDLLAEAEKVKSEPSENDHEEIDESFFDELLQRAEEERRNFEVPVVNLKRECTETATISEPKRKKHYSEPYSNDGTKPKLKVRSDLGFFPAVAGPSKSSKTVDPIGESLLFINNVSQEGIADHEADIKLSAKDKMAKALERILYAKKAFEKAGCQSEKKFYPKSPVFVYTQTVRKLPSCSSHFTQQIYDNRSPLHTINNVSFSFNSTTRFNLHDWGLEAPPPAAFKVARILGYDAETLYLKRKSIKIPDKIQINQDAAKEGDQLFEQSSATLFKNALVQTEDVRILPIRRGDFYRNVGIQYNPQTSSAGTQTSSAYCGSSGTELPLMRIIKSLNENQLQAIDDFVQLIMEPVGQAGIDIYEKRSRLHEIYKISQQPSLSFSTPMLEAPPPPSLINFNYNYDGRSEIKNECSQDPPGSSQRKCSFSNQCEHLRPVNSDWNSSSSKKCYGRGGKRR